MSTYRKLHGQSIQAVTTDPTGTTAEGQVWYNTTSDTFKSIINLEAWNSETPVTTSRQYMQTTGGPSTSSVFFGGYHPGDSSPNTGSVRTEEWNGSGFETGGDSSSKRYSQGGAITSQTAALMFGGYPGPPGGSNATESYNGTSWTTVNTLPNSPSGNMGGGIATSALNVGGNSGSTYYNASAEWDGSNWTAGGNIPQATSQGACVSVGVPNAFLFGGKTGPGTSQTATSITYDGTSWTAANSLPQATENLGGAGPGSSAAIAFGGNTSSSNQITTTHTWNGTNWSTSPATLGTGNASGHSAGNTGTSALAVSGGSSPSAATTAVQNYSSSVNIITAAAWATSTASNTTRYIASGVGSNTACVVYGGVLNPGTTLRAQTEEWDGSSWTESGDLSTARFGIGQGIGTQTAALAYGGYTSTIVNSVEEYDGSSWTAGGAMPATNRIQGGFGIQTAGVSAAGQGSPGKWANVYHYDGSSWTAANAYPTAVEQMAGCGTQTAGLISGGSADPGVVSTQNEYDGTNWTAGGGLNTALAFQNNNGTQTSCQIIGGGTPSYTTAVSTYDGTSVSTAPSLDTARGYGRGTTTSGAVTGAVVTSGSTPATPSSNTSVEFTTKTETVNVKTLTQS